MIKIAICDDETEASSLLNRLLNRIIEKNDYAMEIVCVTNSQDEIFNLVAKNKIDVLFLDINFENNDYTGIDLAHKLRNINKKFYLIFLTGYFEYALLSFKCKTFDYIVKPADMSKLEYTMLRLNDDINSSKSKLIKFKNNVILNERDIIFIEKSGYKAFIHTTNNKIYMTYGSIKELNDILPSFFVQSHRSYIVNKNKIKSVDKKKHVVYFNDELSCPSSDSFPDLLI